MKIKPRPGLIVRDPLTHVPIPAEGIEVGDHDQYWLRRLRDGDVSQIEVKAVTKEAKS